MGRQVLVSHRAASCFHAASSHLRYLTPAVAICLQIDYWLDYASGNVVAGANFEAICNGINDYLALRTFIVGYNLSVADIALWGQLQGVCAWPDGSASTQHGWSVMPMPLAWSLTCPFPPCTCSWHHVEEGQPGWQGAPPLALV